MYSKPAQIVLWPARKALSPSVAACEIIGKRAAAGRLCGRVVLLGSGLSFAGIASANEFDTVLVPGTSHWPWIAIAVVLGLLGVVSYGSRRRIYAVVGS